jgi:hypothetical protein
MRKNKKIRSKTKQFTTYNTYKFDIVIETFTKNKENIRISIL